MVFGLSVAQCYPHFWDCFDKVLGSNPRFMACCMLDYTNGFGKMLVFDPGSSVVVDRDVNVP